MKETIIALFLWPVLSCLLNLVLAKRSRIDAWAESRPNLAAVLKLMRGLGVDPWMIVQAFTLAVHKRLPLAQTAPEAQAKRSMRPPPAGPDEPAGRITPIDDPRERRTPTLPPLPLLCLALLLMGLVASSACSPAAWQSQREVSNVITTANNDVVLPALERAYTDAQVRAATQAESVLDSAARRAVVTEQWQPIWDAYEAFRSAHTAWQVAIETEGDTLASASAARLAYCDLRKVATERVKLPDFPIPGAECR